MRIAQFIGTNGNVVKNQFIIFVNHGTYLQSYDSVVAYNSGSGKTPDQVSNLWNYSRTTTKYVSQFLRMTPKAIEQAIEQGTIELINTESLTITE